MTGSWRRHGSEFPALLYIAAYTLVNASFTKMPKPEDFVKGAREIDGFDVWQALRSLYIWFKGRCEAFPFSKTGLFLEPKDIGVPEAASCLLEMTTLCYEGNLPAEMRSQAAHYGKCEYHLGCYTDTLKSFLDYLYGAADFDETAIGRQIQLANELQNFFKEILHVVNSMPALEAISQFVATLGPEMKKRLRSFLAKKDPTEESLSAETIQRWIAEFRKEENIPLN
jgi:hypothetical protein